MQPETRYAKSGDVHIAYQVLGDGPLNLVIVPGWISHLDLDWDDHRKAPFLERLARFSRLIRFDKRGTGLSDPASGVATLEQRMEDVRAVMDAVGAERAALFGFSEGGQMSILFAASYPDRTQALVLFGTHARATADATYPWGFPDVLARQWDAIEHWGEGRFAAVMNPGQTLDPLRVEQMARRERASASPGMARALYEAIHQTDVRAVLPTIRVPTLVLHRRDDPIPVGGGRYIASRIPGARFVELDGSDHGPWLGDADAVLGEIETFLTGTRHSHEPDRVLATVLFTDIVGSTERASQLGDRRWRELLEDHDRLVRDHLERARGRAVKHTGDGFLATFDGPARAIRCASAIRDAVHQLGIEIRAGLHTGECELMGEDVGGIAVHIGQRVSALAGPNAVLVSSTVKDLVVGSGIRFEDRGTHVLKGVPDQWRLFSVLAS